MQFFTIYANNAIVYHTCFDMNMSYTTIDLGLCFGHLLCKLPGLCFALCMNHLTSYLALYTKPCFPRGLICIDSNSHGTSHFAAYMPFALLIECTVISSTFQPCPCMLSVCLLLSVPCHCLKICHLCPTLCSQSC